MRQSVTLTHRSFLAATFAWGLLLVSGAHAATPYYTIKPIFLPAPDEGPKARNFEIQNFGPVGIGITLTKPPFTMVIRNVETGSPAAATGKLQKGQVIESIAWC